MKDTRGSACRLLILVAAGLLSTAALAVDHAQCSSCHAATPPDGGNLHQPLSALCINCHLGRVDAGEHAVDVPVPRIPAGLPLQGNVMTCVTCHDPHAPGLALRLNDPQLCEACH